MCGITGWIAYDDDLRRRRSTVEAMTATMACRGPDAAGIWLDRAAALGHRRLAVIDLPGGIQPMTLETPTGRLVIVYSGEIYNFIELKRGLMQRGHRFATNSDTEVVLHGYLEWGEYLPDHLNGMFAFAIWDERRSHLVLVRDRAGIKPLFYHRTNDGVIFGSEPKAILANPRSKSVIDAEGFYNLFLDTQSPDRSPWRGIDRVPPGTMITVAASGVRTRTYWRLRSNPHGDDLQTTVHTVRELMTDIVRRQLVADVPQCVLLSGGLDSSAISGLAASHLDKRSVRVRTFSVDPGGQARDSSHRRPDVLEDAHYARQVAERIGSAHTNVIVDARHVADPNVRRAVIRARDAPSLGEMDASLYLLFKSIREESVVALSGESSDELFGGYTWFHDESASIENAFPWSALTQLPIYSPGSVLSMFRPEIARTLDVQTRTGDQLAVALSGVEHLEGSSSLDRRMRVISFLALNRHMQMLLDRKDRLSMAVGLEVRVPYCDHRLVEYAYNIPWSIKIFDGREKSVLRHAVTDLLPTSVVERKKSGYPGTRDLAYATELQRQARDVLSEQGHPVFDLVDPAWLHTATEEDPAKTRRNLSGEINMALDLYHWLEIYRPELRIDSN
ncbi:asparagine synthase (glutamine-hydrolyzing) [Jiangella alba]|uniref:asparagine synthase (glutamine-hydrolyzing) n=1 Tax=Jiangella alba TaxID=561176 RepID=A0A1H5JVL7_9ACTN|nr:asparagine synthase (glutamine-hydrolyzing) [Jiangella alba]SEE56474.1 asparagine synthase (glutamine-hydrolysing) [Jiangella alba]